MIESVIDELIDNNLITESDYKNALEEVSQITDSDYIYQLLIVAQGKKA